MESGWSGIPCIGDAEDDKYDHRISCSRLYGERPATERTPGSAYPGGGPGDATGTD